jgi:hypothetical protein
MLLVCSRIFTDTLSITAFRKRPCKTIQLLVAEAGSPHSSCCFVITNITIIMVVTDTLTSYKVPYPFHKPKYRNIPIYETKHSFSTIILMYLQMLFTAPCTNPISALRFPHTQRIPSVPLNGLLHQILRLFQLLCVTDVTCDFDVVNKQ